MGQGSRSGCGRPELKSDCIPPISGPNAEMSARGHAASAQSLRCPETRSSGSRYERGVPAPRPQWWVRWIYPQDTDGTEIRTRQTERRFSPDSAYQFFPASLGAGTGSSGEPGLPRSGLYIGTLVARAPAYLFLWTVAPARCVLGFTWLQARAT